LDRGAADNLEDAMRKMRRIVALEVLEQPLRVEARLACGHIVESWPGAHTSALRRCRECEQAAYVPLPVPLSLEVKP
jgi:hypothetical protein